MKSVLASIKPKYCELIAKGEKTVEVRKTRPKIETPFKVYMYQTKRRWIYKILEWLKLYQGKVIGEFVCDDVHKFKVFEDGAVQDWLFADLKKSCLGYDDIADYVGRGKTGYAWHISNLVMYDKPRELSEFYIIDYEAVKNCLHRERGYINPDYTSGSFLKGAYICYKNTETEWCGKCKTKKLTRPPQSWCYVEEVGE